MNYSNLALSQTPPLDVPARFMVTAPIFPVLAAVILLVSPSSLADRWSPEMLAVTHLLTLGFISMVMIGALQQLLPILAGIQISQPGRVSLSLHLGLVAGILALCFGFLYSTPPGVIAGAVVIGCTLLLMLVIFLYKLFTSAASATVTVGFKLALFSLLINLLLGLYLAAGHGLPLIPLARQFTTAHISWGVFGWIGIMVFTVSYQVVPMFQITPRYPRWMMAGLAPVTFVLIGILSLPDVGVRMPRLAQVAVALAIVIAFSAFALMTLDLQRRRRRRLPDTTLNFWRLGMISLLTAAVIWCGDLVFGIRLHSHEYLLAFLALCGSAMSLISGMLYKIIPFLVWLHLTNSIDMSQRWQKKIPNMKQIIPDRHGRRQFWLHVAALLLLSVAPSLPAWGIRFALVLFALSNLYLAWNLIGGVRVFSRTVEMMKAPPG